MKILAVAVLLLISSLAWAGETLETVQKRGHVLVGLNKPLPGFGESDEKNEWTGFYADIGRAVAAAVFGDSKKVKFIAYSASARAINALQAQKLDLLLGAARTLNTDAALGLDFVHPVYYDGQGFLVKSGTEELNGLSVCIKPGSIFEFAAADFFKSSKMKWKPLPVDSSQKQIKAFFGGLCDCLTGDVSWLAVVRSAAPKPEEYEIFTQIISNKFSCPAVRSADAQWKDIIDYTILALIKAEELEITSQNAGKMLKTGNVEIRRFLGKASNNGKALGLNDKFVYNIIKNTGNYAEIFDKNLGCINMNRGLNALWKHGGLMIAPPFK